MLALAQANLVARLLAERYGVAVEDIEIRVITTTGDRLTDRPLSEAGGKGLFSKEIEAALLAGEVADELPGDPARARALQFGVTHDELAASLGLPPEEWDKHRIEVIMSRLRAKIDKETGLPLPVRAVRGIGYRFHT